MDLCSELKKEIGLFPALRLKCVGITFKADKMKRKMRKRKKISP